MTLLEGLPFYEGQKIAPLYMQSLVPRAIRIIEFTITGFCGNLTEVDPSRRVPLPQVFTWQKVGPPRRVTLPSR